MQNLTTIIHAAIEAGKAILDVYNTNFEVEFKKDNSPLTIADKNAHEVISSYLSQTGLPVLSEEGRDIPFPERSKWQQFWLVDPLDGTKEFIKRNGEFTVNIALIDNGKPVMGVVYAPVHDILYFGKNEMGAFKTESASNVFESCRDLDGLVSKSIKLPVHDGISTFRIVASRSHLNKETEDFINEKRNQYKTIELVSKGSSLKLCMIAEGKADLYPRFAPTMEWDTAAGHAVIQAAGGTVIQAGKNENVVYNKENLLNPWFIAEAPSKLTNNE